MLVIKNKTEGYTMLSSFRKAREPLSSYTHFWGAAGFGTTGIFLLVKALFSPAFSAKMLISVVVYSISLVALYTASTVYHFSNGKPERVKKLRKLDHSMIYVLIAGTYTPICLNLLEHGTGVLITVMIWALALGGIALKMCVINLPNWVSSVLYIAMGWFIIFFADSMISLSGGAFALLLAGGITYSVGGLIYAIKRPNLKGGWGFHELFHMFILGGSILHFLLILIYIC